ncbi:MAG: FAD-binding oxidoreductase [Actinomycetota bacterium]
MGQKTVDKALDGNFAGTVVFPGEERWDQARAAWNLAADQNPAAVAYAESADDVVAAVNFARANGLGIAAQGTGHGAGPRGPLDGSILLRTERMKGIDIDPNKRVGRYEAGVLWMEANPAAGEHGLANFSGSAPDIGIVGYTTGGGFGWLARRYGLACNHVQAIELVTADGVKRRVDADNDADLFWALRGGGGSFGLVTAIEFDLAELPEVFAGSVIYPADERPSEIIDSYFQWAAALPDDVTSIVRFLRLPPLPQIPEPLQDTPLITLGACYAGPESEGADLIQPIRELGEPVMDTFQTMPPSGLPAVHMEPEEPVPGLVYTASLREAPQEAIDSFIETAGPDSGSPLLSAELRQCGGALGEPANGAGALSHLDAEYVFCGIGLPMSREMGEAINQQIDTICEALKPWAPESRYFNFADRPTDLEAIFAPETLERLRDVKRRYDPDGVVSGNHNISLA